MAEDDNRIPEADAFSTAYPRIRLSSLDSAICRSGELAPSRLWVPMEKASCNSVLLSANLNAVCQCVYMRAFAIIANRVCVRVRVCVCVCVRARTLPHTT